MSGGVDSSVGAALLKEQGYDVLGVYILGWTGTKDFPCSWQAEQADAEVVAKKIGIPFYTVNLSSEYEQSVINEFFDGYKRGVTPNPDILCNKEIKFKAAWQAVRQFEPDFIATGHYAQIKDGQIYKGADDNKDQTYFLWGIDASMLPKILFPIGSYQKPQIRELALKYGLANAKKKDSQGICFVGPLKVREFLATHFTPKQGDAYLENGKWLAKHNGAFYYTIGERLGAGSVEWQGDVPPLYVLAKDIKKNLLVIGKEQDLYSSDFTAEQVNWLAPNAETLVESVKIRYRQEDVPVVLQACKGGYLVHCNKLVRAITPGQSVVFYTQTGLLLGGGIISNVPKINNALTNCEKNRTNYAKHST